MTGKYKQPNSVYQGQGPESLSQCQREHYDVARRFRGLFTPAEFRRLYKQMYPDRAEGSILPSDHCFNRHNKGNKRHPRFLEWDKYRQYCFVGMAHRP